MPCFMGQDIPIATRCGSGIPHVSVVNNDSVNIGGGNREIGVPTNSHVVRAVAVGQYAANNPNIQVFISWPSAQIFQARIRCRVGPVDIGVRRLHPYDAVGAVAIRVNPRQPEFDVGVEPALQAGELIIGLADGLDHLAVADVFRPVVMHYMHYHRNFVIPSPLDIQNFVRNFVQMTQFYFGNQNLVEASSVMPHQTHKVHFGQR